MATLADIVFDCAHPASLARFWAGVLDGYEVEPHDENDPAVLVVAPTGPRLFFQQVPEAKTAKNRVHLDVRGPERAAEVERLVALGASVTDDGHERFTVMVDPEGNEFCVMD